MASAKSGDTVKVHYAGTLSDGTVFDSSQDREPLEFTIGQNMVIPGFENGIVGMNEGDSREIPIPAAEAYGAYNENLVAAVPRSQVPAEMELELGMILQVRSPEGALARAMVRQITDAEVTLDLNHPLAGQDLVFQVQLVKIV